VPKIPSKADLKRFCEIDGWEKTKAVNPDHDRYRKVLEDGSVLRTKVSRGRGPACDDHNLWHAIWGRQLGLDSEDQFWEVLETKQPARRGGPVEAEPDSSLPTWLTDHLIFVMNMDEREVLRLGAEDAKQIYAASLGLDPDDVPLW
jgi:hypothetical protein